MYPYSAVEDALAGAFGVPLEARGALRGRLKNFQKLNFRAAAPGRGKHLLYSASNVYDWGLGLSLAEFGIDPSVICCTIRSGSFAFYWDAAPETGDEERILVFLPTVFSRSSDDLQLAILGTFLSSAVAGKVSLTLDRLGMINLTSLKARIDRQLEAL